MRLRMGWSDLRAPPADAQKKRGPCGPLSVRPGSGELRSDAQARRAAGGDEAEEQQERGDQPVEVRERHDTHLEVGTRAWGERGSFWGNPGGAELSGSGRLLSTRN